MVTAYHLRSQLWSIGHAGTQGLSYVIINILYHMYSSGMVWYGIPQASAITPCITCVDKSVDGDDVDDDGDDGNDGDDAIGASHHKQTKEYRLQQAIGGGEWILKWRLWGSSMR